MRRAITTIGVTAASLLLVVNFRARDAGPSIEVLAALDEPIVIVTTTLAPTTSSTAPTTTTTNPFADSKWYATTTTRAMPPPRETGSTTTTTQAPLPTSPAARTFTGPSIETQFGDLQLQIVVAGDVIEDVIPIELPHRYHTSRSISKWAWKFCRNRTLEAQGSDFLIVSGATVTWRAYVESLDAAMEIAGLVP